MSARRRLVPMREIREVLETLREFGVPVGPVDIRSDGVTVYPPGTSVGNDFDDWQAKDADRERVARRS